MLSERFPTQSTYSRIAVKDIVAKAKFSDCQGQWIGKCVYPKKFIGIYSGDSGSLTVNLTKFLELYTKILDIIVCKLYVHNKLTKITRKKEVVKKHVCTKEIISMVPTDSLIVPFLGKQDEKL